METPTEKSQEQIKFENTCADLCTGDYRRCPLKSVGNVVHWLRAFRLVQYDTVQIGWKDNVGQVTLWSKLIATYVFDEELSMPIFTFDEKHKWCQDIQDNYIEGLKKFENPYSKYMNN